MAEVEIDVFVQQKSDLGDVIRRPAGRERLAGQLHAAVAQVARLTDRRRDEFAPGGDVEYAGRNADTELIGIDVAVDTDKAAAAKQLHEVEIRQDRVEHGQGGLFAMRNVHVEHAWLQCLNEAGRVFAADLPLENQAGVDTPDGQ